MRPILPLVLLGSPLLLAIAGPASGQVWDGPAYAAEWNLPLPHHAPDARDCVAVDLFADLEPDLLLLSNSALYLVAYPASMQFLHPVPGPAGVTSVSQWIDVQTQVASGAFVDAGGLYLLDIDGVATTTPVPWTSGWANATELDLVTIGGERHLVARMANGVEVRTVKQDAGTGNWVAGPAWTSLSGPILDFAVLDYDGDGNRDLAYATSIGLTVVNQSGGVLDFRRSDAPSRVVTVRNDLYGPTYERVAWAVESSPGSWTLRVFNLAGGDTTPFPLEFPVYQGGPSEPVDLLDMAADDLTGDGYDDIVLHDLAARRDVVLENQHVSGGVHFSLSGAHTHYLLLDTNAGESGATNLCVPVIRDLDLDGALDVVVPAVTQEGDVLVFELNELDPPDPGSLKALLLGQRVGGFSRYFQHDPPLPTGDAWELRLTFEDVGDAFRNTSYTHVQVRMWHEHEQDGLTGDSIDKRFELQKENGAWIQHQAMPVRWSDYFLDSPPLPWRRFYMEFRAVELGGQGQIVAASVPKKAAFAMQHDATPLTGYDKCDPAFSDYFGFWTWNYAPGDCGKWDVVQEQLPDDDVTYVGIHVRGILPPPMDPEGGLPAVPTAEIVAAFEADWIQ